jgi:hypothetical protein
VQNNISGSVIIKLAESVWLMLPTLYVKRVSLSCFSYVALYWNAGYGQAGAFLVRGSRSLECYICFAKEPDQSSPTSSPRSYLSIPESRVDPTRIRHWISVGESNHYEYCNPPWSLSTTGPTIPGMEVVRPINVVDECLVELEGPCIYLALSYVWGGVPNFRLTTRNKSTLMQRRAIRNVRYRLPRTIQDAIDLVKALEYRFLWVDALCIVQNGQMDMQSRVDQMNLIYERAVMTIAAAVG